MDTLRFAAAECRKLTGEMIPMEASASAASKIGFTLRVPVGVVAAITPFNFPLNLVAHKVAPAIAAGCSIVVKPAPATPLSALAFAELLDSAGVPAGFVNVVTGGGATGAALCEHPAVACVSFTGSTTIGWSIRTTAPRKKVLLELGSAAPLIIDADGDAEKAAVKASVAGFSHAGQSCISTQQVYVHTDVADRFIATFVNRVENLIVGDPRSEATDVSQLINTGERDRVCSWIDDAIAAGATVLAGHSIQGDGVLAPTILTDVTPDMHVVSREVFGPVVSITVVNSLDDAITAANSSDFGLQVGVFTRDVSTAMRAARALDYGGVMINDVPTFRADQQPYGGVRESGNTREGPAYATAEFTNLRMVAIELD